YMLETLPQPMTPTLARRGFSLAGSAARAGSANGPRARAVPAATPWPTKERLSTAVGLMGKTPVGEGDAGTLLVYAFRTTAARAARRAREVMHGIVPATASRNRRRTAGSFPGVWGPRDCGAPHPAGAVSKLASPAAS